MVEETLLGSVLSSTSARAGERSKLAVCAFRSPGRVFRI
ncbi:unnamed protein product [Tilletia caries]|uniref:Uncharacterized protein n=1 Tax=Tilletia caries TaxID=13290 RepID=A0ABN7IXR7_9BASI|nr:unnamed protein product [Tilletia caries]CAD6944550.1 unnamed protein product [Tilletia caries]